MPLGRPRPPFLLALALAAAAALPVPAAPFACPPGWQNEAQGCDPALCVAPMGAAVIRIDRFAVVGGVAPEAAFDGYEKIVTADGTPLQERLGQSAPALAGAAALRRDYAGTARGRALRVALVLVRAGGEDLLLRAVWQAEGGALLEMMIGAAIAGWEPNRPTPGTTAR